MAKSNAPKFKQTSKGNAGAKSYSGGMNRYRNQNRAATGGKGAGSRGGNGGVGGATNG